MPNVMPAHHSFAASLRQAKKGFPEHQIAEEGIPKTRTARYGRMLGKGKVAVRLKQLTDYDNTKNPTQMLSK